MTESQTTPGDAVRGESRWLMALAVVTVGGLQELVPHEFRVTPRIFFLFPILLLMFLAVLIVGDPGRIDRDRRWLRVTTALMIGCMTFVTAGATVRLVVGIVSQREFGSAADLLIMGGIIWLTTVIVFALWYWDIDAGGPAARALGKADVPPSFVFTEASLPDLVGPRWYPHFVDYLALSFNTSLSFSPTDVPPIRRWAKFLMILQSLISLTVAALVLARAINML